MKRTHQNRSAFLTGGGGGGSGGGGENSSSVNGVGESSYTNSLGKAKMCDEREQHGGGLDELMAVLGYKVKSSDMAEVAQKLEQLEQAMCSVEQDGLSQLASETVHYNPSDLSSWVESMLSELNPLENSTSLLQDPFSRNNPQSSSSSAMVFDDSSFDSDLTAIPGNAVYPQNFQPQPPPASPPHQKPVSSPYQTLTQPQKLVSPPENKVPPTNQTGAGVIGVAQPSHKRLKPNSINTWDMMQNESVASSATPRATEFTRPVVLVDSQENGIRLVHTLMACAEAVQQENYKVAEALVKRIGFLAVSQAGAMRKVATYFAEALARRIYKLYPTNQNDVAFTDYLEMHFYETCPYLKFAHFTANQAILETFAGKSKVHIIDFGIKQGMQWPALLQALALRPGGPPSFRLTGIGPPSSDNTDDLQHVGWKLAQLAETVNVTFEYRGFLASSLADLDASLFDIRDDEIVAVNSIFELHQMLARPGAFEKVLSVVKNLRPAVLTVVEQEANHNGPVFLDRFTESLHYYSTLFDSLEGGNGGGSSGGDGDGGAGGGRGVSDQDRVMSEVYLGRQICNVVACEGLDRVERHETLAQWRARFKSAGFEPVHLGSNAFKQASMLLALFGGGDGYRVEENNGCLMLGWHTRPLIATSAWKLGMTH